MNVANRRIFAFIIFWAVALCAIVLALGPANAGPVVTERGLVRAGQFQSAAFVGAPAAAPRRPVVQVKAERDPGESRSNIALAKSFVSDVPIPAALPLVASAIGFALFAFARGRGRRGSPGER